MRSISKMQRDQHTLALKMLHEKKAEIRSISSNKNVKQKKFKSIEIIERDLNGSLNILLKGRCIIEGKTIPDYMNRKTFVRSNNLTYH